MISSFSESIQIHNDAVGGIYIMEVGSKVSVRQ